MSQWDVEAIMDKVKEKYPHAEKHEEICLATQVRQEAVAKQAGEADVLIVVGDPMSNNSNRLAQVSEEIAHTKAYRVGDVSEIEIDWIKEAQTVAVTAGASTPTPIVREVIAFIEQFNPFDQSTWVRENKVPLTKILPKVRKPRLTTN